MHYGNLRKKKHKLNNPVEDTLMAMQTVLFKVLQKLFKRKEFQNFA